MFNYSALVWRLKQKYKTQKNFAEALGMTTVGLNQRLNNRIDWRPKEILKACKLLDIDISEMHTYFFSTNDILY